MAYIMNNIHGFIYFSSLYLLRLLPREWHPGCFLRSRQGGEQFVQPGAPATLYTFHLFFYVSLSFAISFSLLNFSTPCFLSLSFFFLRVSSYSSFLSSSIKFSLLILYSFIEVYLPWHQVAKERLQPVARAALHFSPLPDTLSLSLYLVHLNFFLPFSI